MNWTKIIIPTLTLAVGAGGTAAFFLADGGGSMTSSTANYPGVGMMGAGSAMAGGGSDIARGATGGFVPARRMVALAATIARSVHHEGHTLYYRSAHVTLVALGAPGSRPGMYWQIDGIVGPTVSVPARATITVDFANGDPGHPHGFELTTAAPPYPRMAMMVGQVAANGAFVMPVPAPQGNLWYATSTSFAAPSPGTYYIICPVPGHAQQGMWSKFIVR